MSFWMLVLLAFFLQTSEASGENGRKLTMGEQLDVIIKDVSSYLSWLFGYSDDVSEESQIDEAEFLTEEFVKDVNNMVEMMHAESVKHIKNNSKDEDNKDEKNSDDKIDENKVEIKKESSSSESKEYDDVEVIPLSSA